MTDPAPAPTRNSVVSLREVTRETVRTVVDLEVSEAQQRFVAPNAVSISEAHFEPKAWFRTIYADETPVGFVMLYDDPEKTSAYLWRYMIDARYQGNGFGRQALEQVIEHVKSRPNTREMRLSYVPGEGAPNGFYEKLGFKDTGEEFHGELEMKLVFTRGQGGKATDPE